MVFSSKKARGTPPTAKSSFKSAVRSLKDESLRSSTACFMIICLHFLGCKTESIFRVLESYDLGYTIMDVARYIKDEDLFQHSNILDPPHDYSNTCSRNPKITLTVEFAQARPIELKVSASCIPSLSPRNIVNAVTSDGQQVVTVMTKGQLRFQLSHPSGLKTRNSI